MSASVSRMSAFLFVKSLLYIIEASASESVQHRTQLISVDATSEAKVGMIEFVYL